ncbi:MAG: hypothetical protein GY757_55200 [bacterium]|nr:hypothetical protein [bacterium]
MERVLKFEPRETPLTEENVISLDVALWESNCEKEFYIYKGNRGYGSSLFPQNTDYVRDNFEELKKNGSQKDAETWFQRSALERTVKMNCRKLDDILIELKEDTAYHFLKVDAQGAEYQVLKGAENFLTTSCLGLCLELFVVPLYEGITLLPAVEEYLYQLGFEMERKYQPHGTFDSQHDCLFLKRGADGEATQIQQTIRKLYRQENIREMYQIAVKAVKTGNHNLGKSYFKEVTQSQYTPADLVAGAWIFLGDIGKEQAEKGWERCYQKALLVLENKTTNGNAELYRIASLYKRLNQLKKAGAIFKQVLNQTGDEKLSAGIYFHLGEMAYNEKNSSDATVNFNKCLQLLPQHREAQKYLSQLGKK